MAGLDRTGIDMSAYVQPYQLYSFNQKLAPRKEWLSMTTISPNTATAALKKLFDRQMAEAVELSGDEAGIKALFSLLEKIGKVTEGEGKTPFVIVVQNPNLTLSKRMAKVVLNGKTGVNYLNDNRITNLDDLPQGHYLAVDVEDGRAILNTKPSICLEQFRLGKRFGGTAVEGITVVTYEVHILAHHHIDLPGSRDISGVVPFLCVVGNNKWAGLSARWGVTAFPNYGSLSCGSRLGLGT